MRAGFDGGETRVMLGGLPLVASGAMRDEVRRLRLAMMVGCTVIVASLVGCAGSGRGESRPKTDYEIGYTTGVGFTSVRSENAGSWCDTMFEIGKQLDPIADQAEWRRGCIDGLALKPRKP